MNHSASRIVLIAMTSFATLGPPIAVASDDDHDPINECGVLSLYLLLRSETSRPIELADLRRSLPSPDERGLSMADLIEGARNQGVRLRGVRFRPEDAPLDRPAIAWLRQDDEAGGHFVLLKPVGVTGTMVMLLDFPSPPRILDYTDLVASPRWTGRLLVPARWQEGPAPKLALLIVIPVVGLLFIRPGRLRIGISRRFPPGD
ncbi:hypothetical protein BH23PLA1_BH23PLA1_31170 [soil metagenome]